MSLNPCFMEAADPVAPQFRTLDLSDLDAFVALQEKICTHLGPERAHHLKPRTREHLLRHLAAGMDIPGVFVAGRLAGQLVLADPARTDAVYHLEGYPLRDLGGVPAVVQAVGIDPACRAQGYARGLLGYAQRLAAARGHDRLLAKVALDNAQSLACFTGAGFSRWASGVDPAKGYAVHYLGKTISYAPQHALALPPTLCAT